MAVRDGAAFDIDDLLVEAFGKSPFGFSVPSNQWRYDVVRSICARSQSTRVKKERPTFNTYSAFSSLTCFLQNSSSYPLRLLPPVVRLNLVYGYTDFANVIGQLARIHKKCVRFLCSNVRPPKNLDHVLRFNDL